MPRKKRATKQRTTEDMRRILSNPFTMLDEAWLTPGFPWPEAKRLWRAIRDEVLADWAKRYPGHTPWAVHVFDKGGRHAA